MTFTEWLKVREMLSPVPFPTRSPDRNPWINGKFATCAFTTGKAKVTKNAERDSINDRKANLKQDGYHL